METILLGKTLKTRGLKGEIKASILTSSPEVKFAPNSLIFIDQNKYVIIKSSIKDNFVYLYLKNINSIEEAENLINKEIRAEKKEEEGKIYVSDLVGYTLIGNSNLGKVVSFYTINKTPYISNDNKHMMPLIKNVFYSKIDEVNKIIYLEELGEECLHD